MRAGGWGGGGSVSGEAPPESTRRNGFLITTLPGRSVRKPAGIKAGGKTGSYLSHFNLSLLVEAKCLNSTLITENRLEMDSNLICWCPAQFCHGATCIF